MKLHKHHQTKHHRKPRSIGGTNEARNISLVSKNQHEAWHLLFANHSAETICAIINERWLDPDFELVCTKKLQPQKHRRAKRKEVVNI